MRKSARKFLLNRLFRITYRAGYAKGRLEARRRK